MKLLHYLFVSDSISRTLLKKSFIWVLFIVKFLEVTATILKLNVATIFHLTVQVGLNLALTPLWDIARKQMPRQVSQRIVITNAETLMDSILLLIGKFIEHWAEIGHLVVILDRPRIVVQFISAFTIAVRSAHRRLTIDVRRRFIWWVLRFSNLTATTTILEGHIDAVDSHGLRSIRLARRPLRTVTQIFHCYTHLATNLNLTN